MRYDGLTMFAQSLNVAFTKKFLIFSSLMLRENYGLTMFAESLNVVFRFFEATGG